MPIPQTPGELMDHEFLGIRARLIELAATLDRLDRAGASDDGASDDGDTMATDSRLSTIRESLGVLAGEDSNRAEQLQLLFSLPYREQWKDEYDS